MSREDELKRIARAANRTGFRMRFDHALQRTLILLPPVLLYALGALIWVKIWQPSGGQITRVALVGAVPVVVWLAGTIHAWLQPRPAFAGAMRLDQHHGLHDRISSALEFIKLPKAERSPFMEAAIEDAVVTAKDLKPAGAAPIHLYLLELVIIVFLLLSLLLVWVLYVPRYVVIEDDTQHINPLVLSPDDVDLFRNIADQMKQENKDPEVLAAVNKFNQLVEDIADRRLDRQEVFRRLEELERDLMKGAEADKEGLDEGLKAIAQELKKSDLTKPIAKELEDKKLTDAEKAMRKLAERLRNKKNPPSKAELEKLRKAMQKASEANASRAKALDAARKSAEEEKKRLLKKKQDEGKLSQKDKSLLKKKQRELERLNREKDKTDRGRRQLSRLDRELAKAAQDLLKEMGASAKDLEEAAQDINRMAKQEMTDKEKEELRKRLQEMRELLRQQGKGDKKQLQRLLRFGQKARGGKPGKGGQGGSQPGGKGGKLRPGKGGSQPGDGPGGISLGKGQGGKSIPIPGEGSGAGQGAGKGQGAGQGAGQGMAEGGSGKGKGEGWGTGHDPNVKGDKSEIKGSTKDVTAVASDTGQGTASSQVISGAAQRGFVGRGYKQVYTDYKTVAEDVMNRDDIPPGYKFYVRRYFQLIRPRD